MANKDIWIEQARRALEGYDEKLLRQVANRLFRPRSQWPVDELIERTLTTLTNPPVLDRRLKDLPPACRQVLALIAHSRQPCWRVGNLVEMLVTLGQADGLEPIKTLIETGLLFPFFSDDLPTKQRLKDISLALALSSNPAVFTLPQVSARALGEPLWTKDEGGRMKEEEKGRDSSFILPPSSFPLPVLEADGLDWPLRLAVLWQTVSAGPLRWTQQGDFFKRDLDRLRQDPLLAAQPHDALAEIPDPGLLVVSMALALGILKEKDDKVTGWQGDKVPQTKDVQPVTLSPCHPVTLSSDLIAGEFPQAWNEGLPATLESLWSRLPWLPGWNALDGWQPAEPIGNPFPGVYLLALLLLGQLGANEWAQPEALEAWILRRHPFWRSAGEEKLPVGAITRFLLGVAYPLRLLQAMKAKDEGGRMKDEEHGDDSSFLLPPSSFRVRLSPMGRWLLGLGEVPPAVGTYPQTLLVQPTLEILAYRQGLTPELVVRMSRFATWKGLGAACTLQIEPESVYRALEAGETFASLVQVLERYGMKAMPAAVIESLRTWSNKRDRITVYPAGVLLEFSGPDELAEALARGLPAVRLSDRLAVVQSETELTEHYHHFRLTGTRDYLAIPDQCVDVDDDGVTLSIDMTRSDLLLEPELLRFAEPLPPSPSLPVGRKLFQLTPASVSAGRNQGLAVSALEKWFLQRTGAPLPAAARMLLIGPESPFMTLRQQLVLSVGSPDVADGLQQWPATRGLIESRLGPTCLSVVAQNVPALRERLRELGMEMKDEG